MQKGPSRFDWGLFAFVSSHFWNRKQLAFHCSPRKAASSQAITEADATRHWARYCFYKL